MSHSKNDQVFPGDSMGIASKKIAKSIAKALRQDYGELTSAVKWIGRRTGVHPRAIRNWYEGRNAPHSVHLLMLARSSPNVLRVLLELVGEAALWGGYNSSALSALEPPKILKGGKIYSDRFVTINVRVDLRLAGNLNQRQLWFLGELQTHKEARAEDIATAWQVALRTAKRDIAGLTESGLICFRGAKKTGWYEVTS